MDQSDFLRGELARAKQLYDAFVNGESKPERKELPEFAPAVEPAGLQLETVAA